MSFNKRHGSYKSSWGIEIDNLTAEFLDDIFKKKAVKPEPKITEESNYGMNVERIRKIVKNNFISINNVTLEEITNNIKKLELTDEEKRVSLSIVLFYVKEISSIKEGQLESTLLDIKKNNSYMLGIEKSASHIIEAFMCPNYRGYLKHLLVSIVKYYGGFDPTENDPKEVVEGEEVIDSLTMEKLNPGDLFYNVKSKIGENLVFTDYSYNSLVRADQVLVKLLGTSYFYNI